MISSSVCAVGTYFVTLFIVSSRKSGKSSKTSSQAVGLCFGYAGVLLSCVIYSHVFNKLSIKKCWLCLLISVNCTSGFALLFDLQFWHLFFMLRCLYLYIFHLLLYFLPLNQLFLALLIISSPFIFKGCCIQGCWFDLKSEIVFNITLGTICDNSGRSVSPSLTAEFPVCANFVFHFLFRKKKSLVSCLLIF